MFYLYLQTTAAYGVVFLFSDEASAENAKTELLHVFPNSRIVIVPQQFVPPPPPEV